MEGIIKVIESISSSHSNVNPTEIYNEGWMTRLLVYYSFEERLVLNQGDFEYSDFPNEPNQFRNSLNEIVFNKSFKWSSEALISSPFIGKEAKPFNEGYTHADMAIGDFKVDYLDSGKLKLLSGPNLFGIIEAKMGSNLSQGTTNAPEYNQASRNLACIAENTYDKICPTYFGVVAPQSTFKKHGLVAQVNKTFMIEQIKERFNMYPAGSEIRKNENAIIIKAQEINVFLISYKSWINKFTDPIVKKTLEDFYLQCKKWNRI